MADPLRARYHDLLTGSYDCVDRIVLTAYSLANSPGGMRMWWRALHGDDEHLMRMAGRFSRRVRAWGQANGVPVIDCGRERKHRIAEDYLTTHHVATGVFLVLVARAPATVWHVDRTQSGVTRNLEKRRAFVNHYSFHIMDPTWGMSPSRSPGTRPSAPRSSSTATSTSPARRGPAASGSSRRATASPRFTGPQALAEVADTLSRSEAVGRLSQVCDRWIYSACLCFGLTLADQQASGFRYSYSLYQVEYSRNPQFVDGARMDRVFDRSVNRTRSRLDVPTPRTLFGVAHRPHRRGGADLSPRQAVVVQTPRWDLTSFKIHFGLLTVKAYTKRERVLRFEAITHNTKGLRCGQRLDRFPDIVTRLAGMLERFTTIVDCVDVAFVPDDTLDRLPLPSQIGATRVGGIDLNKPRMRAALSAALALAVPAEGFSMAAFTAKVHATTGATDADYSTRQAAYDLRKLRGKQLVAKAPRSRRYQMPVEAARSITTPLVLRDQVIPPILAGVRSPRRGRKPAAWTAIDRRYETLRIDIQALLDDLGLAAA